MMSFHNGSQRSLIATSGHAQGCAGDSLPRTATLSELSLLPRLLSSTDSKRSTQGGCEDRPELTKVGSTYRAALQRKCWKLDDEPVQPVSPENKTAQ